jgi:hypothetical protein
VSKKRVSIVELSSRYNGRFLYEPKFSEPSGVHYYLVLRDIICMEQTGNCYRILFQERHHNRDFCIGLYVKKCSKDKSEVLIRMDAESSALFKDWLDFRKVFIRSQGRHYYRSSV